MNTLFIVKHETLYLIKWPYIIFFPHAPHNHVDHCDHHGSQDLSTLSKILKKTSPFGVHS